MNTIARWGVSRTATSAAALFGLVLVATSAHAQEPGSAPPGPPPPAAAPPAVPAGSTSGALGLPPPPAIPPVSPPPRDLGAPGDAPSPPLWLYLEPYDYKEGQPIPRGYEITHKQRRWPLALGASVFGGAYLISAVVGFAGMLLNRQNPQDWGPMFIPVVGPFVAIKTVGADGVNGSDGAAGLLGVAGAVQAAGLATFAIGMLIPPKKVLIPSTPYGEVEVTGRRRGPVLELGIPRLDVAWIPAPGGDRPRASLVLEGTFDL